MCAVHHMRTLPSTLSSGLPAHPAHPVHDHACSVPATATTVQVQEHAAEQQARPSSPSDDLETSFDITADKHKGQYALRKLYHDSDRPIAVLYTAPTCGPCRSLKPILNSVIDEYKGKVHYVEVRGRTEGFEGCGSDEPAVTGLSLLPGA